MNVHHTNECFIIIAMTFKQFFHYYLIILYIYLHGFYEYLIRREYYSSGARSIDNTYKGIKSYMGIVSQLDSLLKFRFYRTSKQI